MTPNAQQQAVIDCRFSTVAVTSCPGGGKSSTLCARIRRQHELYPNKRRAVMTFTQAAARELRERLEGVPLWFVGTLHAFCFGLLQRHGASIGFRAGGINLLTEEQADEMLKQCAIKLGYAKAQGDKVKWLSGLSMRALKANDSPQAGAVRREYVHTLRRNNIVDYDGVLSAGLELLGEEGQVPRIDELYVDEAQDSGETDWAIYQALPAMNWFFVGDIDQSVYGWRGARPERYLEILEQLGDRAFILDLNYRSGTAICEASTRLIRHNKARIDHAVVPSEDRPSEIHIRPYVSDQTERYDVARLVGRAIAAGTPPEEIAVLCRRNDLADQFRDTLAIAGHVATAPPGPVTPPGLGVAMDALSLANDPRNDIVAERVLAPMLGTHIVQDLRLRSAASGNGLLEEAILRGRMSLPSAAESDLDSASNWMRGLGATQEAILFVRGRAALLPEFSLPALLHDLYTRKEWGPERAMGVHTGTVHSVKGREFDVVFVVACEEGVFPMIRDDTSGEEERRLFFVAITRARTQLHLSWAEERTAWGKTRRQVPSRFLEEMQP